MIRTIRLLGEHPAGKREKEREEGIENQ